MDIETVVSDKNVKLVFDHFRNLIISSTVTGAGVYLSIIYFEKREYFPLSVGIIIVLIGLGLLILNSVHILSKLIPDSNPSRWLLIALPICVFATIFLFEALWKLAANL